MTNNIQSPIRLSAGFSTETLQVFFLQEFLQEILPEGSGMIYVK